MIQELKKQLLEEPEIIKNIMEIFGFCNVTINTKELKCAREEGSSANAIHMKLIDNDNLFIKDFARDVSGDLIKFIIETKGVEFKDVIKVIKEELGIQNSYYNSETVTKRQPFGGFYNKIKQKKSVQNIQTYGESVLNKYEKVNNLRFFRDGISFATQRKFDIGFDIESQRITIPIFDSMGNIMGVKGRANWDVNTEEGELKYIYLLPCPKTLTLYGYSQNYNTLYNNTIVIGEAEKFVLQTDSMGHYNTLGTGGSSLSKEQCLLIMSLQPKEVIFAYDEGLNIDTLISNIVRLRTYSRLMGFPIKYWNYKNSKYIAKGSKMSISDLGKEVYEKILEEEIIEYV